ncbi:MAG: HAMP domain-containing histidine kinase [Myxococcales bacterium]|nr:HAMP domain-containing histidine kinase [Myxococcales bacterium]
MRRALFFLFAVILAGAALATQVLASRRAVDARRVLVSELSATLGRARTLDVAAQQIRAETGTARPAAALVAEAVATARSARERAQLTQSLTCLTDGGCADAAGSIARAQEGDRETLAALWADVEAAEKALKEATFLAAGLLVLGLLAGFGTSRGAGVPGPAPVEGPPPAEPSVAAPDTTALEEMLRHRLEALYRARSQLGDNARFAAFGELAAALSHGLKTPLAGVLASVQLAQLKLGDGNAARAELDEVIRLTEGLSEQVQRFLRASGQVGPQRQPVRCAEVLEPLASTYSPEAAHRGVTFTCPPAAPDAWVEVDPSLLDMALRNLVENALAVVRRGQAVTVSVEDRPAPPRVGLDASAPPPGQRFWAFVVGDQGPGLPDAARRVEAGATTRAQGSGLGLAIARRVAERHDGTLILEDRPGGGSRVSLVLPAAQPAQEGA